jgi:hypothetical protein
MKALDTFGINQMMMCNASAMCMMCMFSCAHFLIPIP